MVYSLALGVSTFILFVISGLGYWGVFILMTLESADVPVPSEIILLFAGFLAYTGRFDVVLVILVASLGNLFGSLINYWLGYRYQRQAVVLLEKARLVSSEEVTRVHGWLENRGLAMVFLGRFFPVVRTFISFPAGMSRINLKHFILLTFIGSFIWSAVLAYIGYVAGYNWIAIEPYFRQFDYLVMAFIVLGILLEVNRRFGKRKRGKITNK
jgi:membrane protein DedA with SNARE-associated domain